MAGKKVLGLIPAKGGSTRLAYKNILPLGGKPLLAWSAQAAMESGVCQRIILSTEDEEVARVAREVGLDVPFMRPAHLAKDPAGVVDVALHALDALAEDFDILVILLPTCPFRHGEDIRAAFRLFQERQGLSLMSVSPFSHTPFAAMRVAEDGLMTPWFPEYSGRKSQQMPAAYRPNGAVHVLDVNHFRQTRSYYAPPLLAYVMPEERSIDIDTIHDLRLAEAMIQD